jgi:DNA-binding NtrC family response regulator
MSKILVVDDEPVVLNMVAATLQREKYDVLTAASAAEALQQAKLYEGDISLLIVNHSVDAIPGRNLVDEILPVQRQMKVLRFSGHLENELRARGEIRPESFFIQKPFMPKQLIGKVREIIGPA